MKQILQVFTILVLFFYTIPGVQAATYYVSPSGSGSACSNSSPCSISQPNLSAGDNLYLKGGTYVRGTMLNFSSSGTSSSGITISSAPGEHAVISGDVNGNNAVNESDGPRANGDNKWTPLVRLAGDYIIFKDIEVKFSGGRGIGVDGDNIIVSGCNVHHTWNNGILVDGSNNTVDHNTLWRAAESNYCGGSGGTRACNDDWPGGLGWGATDGSGTHGRNTTVRNNTVYNVSGEGILCMQTSGGVIEGNVVYDNWGMGIYFDSCSNVTIRKNLIYYTDDRGWWRFSNGSQPAHAIQISNEAINNYSVNSSNVKIFNNIMAGAGSGFSFWRGYLSGSHMINFDIENNTIVEDQGGGTGIDLDSGSHSNVNVRNNIVYQISGTPARSSGTGVSFSNNLWYSGSGVSGSGDVKANPLLVDPGHTRNPGSVIADWYKITANSPAINKGIYLSQVTTDFFGQSRSNPPDIGAHEYGSSENPSPTSPINNKPGDANGDGRVDGVDYIVWLNHYGQNVTGAVNGNFNGQGGVDGVDYIVWINNYSS